MESFVSTLKNFLMTLNPTKQIIFIDSLTYQIGLWSQESSFDYNLLPTYKFGDFVHINLGINIGSEQGGPRYGVVAEDSAKLSKTVLVIPIHGEQTYRLPKRFEVYVGKPSPFLTKDHHYVTITQIRSISKMRIDRKYNKLNSTTIDSVKNGLKRILKLT